MELMTVEEINRQCAELETHVNQIVTEAELTTRPLIAANPHLNFEMYQASGLDEFRQAFITFAVPEIKRLKAKAEAEPDVFKARFWVTQAVGLMNKLKAVDNG